MVDRFYKNLNKLLGNFVFASFVIFMDYISKTIELS